MEKKGELTLETFIERLHELFSAEEISTEDVQQTMESYTPKYSEWKKYENYDKHRYTRNLVDTGNGKFNLILLCWGEGHGSGIHDHSDAHCWLKVMQGTLTEKLYEWPKEQGDQLLHPHQITQVQTNQVAYINDSIGLHRIENTSHTEPAVSLHLYSPPFATCHSFDERSGRKIQCKVTFYSKQGKRTPFGKTPVGESSMEQT